MPDRATRCRDLLQASRTRWLTGDAAGTWAALAQAETLAGVDPVLVVEVWAARSVAHVRAEQGEQALAAAARCLELAAGLRAGQARMAPVRAAMADARVSHALVRAGAMSSTRAPVPPEARAEATAELDAIAATPDPVLDGARTRAITAALVLRLDDLDADLASGRSEAQAWSWVSRARVLSENLASPGTVVRQAVDLGFRTGQWERAWDYALSDVDRDKDRNEQVALLSKAALLAWERRMDREARDLGRQARAASVAVDLPWVRTYAYLGGVIAAASGAGSLAAALHSYRTCTTEAGHRTRPHRAWLAAQVALDAGHPPDAVRTFLTGTLPQGLERAGLRARTEAQLRHAEGMPVPPERLQPCDLPAQEPPEL